jgi:hypothetical protein
LPDDGEFPCSQVDSTLFPIKILQSWLRPHESCPWLSQIVVSVR